MKKFTLRSVALLLLCFAVVFPAFAQTVDTDGKRSTAGGSARVGGVDRTDVDANGRPLHRTVTMTPTGGFQVSEESKDRDFVLLYGNMLSTVLCDSCGCPSTRNTDSTAMVYVRGYTRLKLRVRFTFPQSAICPGYTPSVTTVDSLLAMTFGFQFRTNTNAAWDTTGGAVRSEWKRSSTYGVSDSIGSMAEVMRVNTGITSNPDVGEVVFTLPFASAAVGASASTWLTYQNFTREFEVLGRDGQPITGDFFGFRIRPLLTLQDNGSGQSSVLAVGKPVFFTADLYGAR